MRLNRASSGEMSSVWKPWNSSLRLRRTPRVGSVLWSPGLVSSSGSSDGAVLGATLGALLAAGDVRVPVAVAFLAFFALLRAWFLSRLRTRVLRWSETSRAAVADALKRRRSSWALYF